MSDSFETFIECYFEMRSVFATTLLTGLALLTWTRQEEDATSIPGHLQAEYRLLHLQAEMSLAEVTPGTTNWQSAITRM